jgi:hypothetical protein
MSRTVSILNGHLPPLILIRHYPEQTALPILRYAIHATLKEGHPLLLISVLHPPSVFVEFDQWPTLHLLDLSGYSYSESMSQRDICGTVLEQVIRRVLFS